MVSMGALLEMDGVFNQDTLASQRKMKVIDHIRICKTRTNRLIIIYLGRMLFKGIYEYSGPVLHDCAVRAIELKNLAAVSVKVCSRLQVS